MPRFLKADVETHSSGYGRGSRPAINVKVYKYPTSSKVEDAFHCSETVAQQALQYAFEAGQSRFWEDVQEAARDIFGKHVKVYSKGRSGGWLVVHGINEEVEAWDAIALGRWARLVRWCEREVHYLSSWDYVKDDIAANRWAEVGAEAYNYVELTDGRDVCLVDLKHANRDPGTLGGRY